LEGTSIDRHCPTIVSPIGSELDIAIYHHHHHQKEGERREKEGGGRGREEGG